jgi:UPF0755 protein
MKRIIPLLAVLGACSTGAVERVPIPPSSSVRAVADSLAAHGIIWSAAYFRLRVRMAGAGRNLKSGIYALHRGGGTEVALRALRSGDAMHFRITLPIGGTLYDLARSAHTTLGLADDSILAAARDSALREHFGITGPSAEGWLKPESFDFGGFDNARDVVRRFVAARQTSWDTGWDARARRAGLDREGLLTVASIVESEAKDPAERPMIAAVYRNRLRAHMPLQADPTIEYAYLLRDGTRKGRLYDKDYLFDSPWNTYEHAGLPPSPVGSPSRESIEAALSPADVPYLYFVAGPDGKSVFATTYPEHLRNIRKLRGPG